MDKNSDNPVKRGRGRPKKSELEAKKPGGRGKVGRPPGEKAIMDDYKARLLRSPQSRKVMQKVIDVALDDTHAHQAACMKMIMDRVAPAANFVEKDSSKGAGGIEITIKGLDASVGKVEEPVDAEFEDISGDVDE